MLHLLEHMARRDNQDPFSSAAPDQLGQYHADFQRLAQANRICQQNPRSQIRGVKRLSYGRLLIAEGIGQHVSGNRHRVPAQRYGGFAQGGLKPQPRPSVVVGIIGHDSGLGRVEHLNVVEALIKTRGRAPDQLR